MDIRLLRYFLAVAREENITRAAENLQSLSRLCQSSLWSLKMKSGNSCSCEEKEKSR